MGKLVPAKNSSFYSRKGEEEKRDVGRERERDMINSHISKSYFTEQHESNIVGGRCAAVVSTLRDHVCKVDSLAKHVASHRCLRGSNTKTLHEMERTRFY